MKIKKGEIKEDRSRDVFWQRSFIENEAQIRSKIIVCASLEALSAELNKPMVNFLVDDAVKAWFNNKTDKLISELRLSPQGTEMVTLTHITPQMESLHDFVMTL